MKKRALDKAYSEIETKYKNMSEDEVKKQIENLEKEIEGKRYASYRLKGENKEKLEGEIAKLNKKLENIKGYSKNKDQISKIIDVRNQLEDKLVKVTGIKENSKKEYENSKKKIEKINNLLKDANKTMNMDQYEYNDLLIQKENLEKEMKKQKEIFEKLETKIADIKTKIGKCNLAWRTLFANKTWDDIQLRATKSKEKFTKQIDKEAKTEKESKQPQDKEEQQIQEEIANNVKNIMKEKEENLPAKVTAWTKFKNLFKSIPEKIKSKFEKEKVVEKSKEQNGKKEKSNDNKEQKDAFLEGLRQHVDVDYKEAVRKAKEQQYIKQHQVKSKSENQK